MKLEEIMAEVEALLASYPDIKELGIECAAINKSPDIIDVILKAKAVTFGDFDTERLYRDIERTVKKKTSGFEVMVSGLQPKGEKSKYRR